MNKRIVGLLGATCVVGACLAEDDVKLFDCKEVAFADRIETKRVSGLAVSIAIPETMRRIDAESPDSEILRWEDAGVTITYSYYPLFGVDPKNFESPSEHECVVYTNDLPGYLDGRIIDNGHYYVGVIWPRIPHEGYVFTLTFVYKRSEAFDAVVLPVINSVRFVSDPDQLIINDIRPDEKEVEIKDESGVVKRLTVGDYITRDFGEIVAIADGVVAIKEMVYLRRTEEWIIRFRYCNQQGCEVRDQQR